jgi:TonB family protein
LDAVLHAKLAELIPGAQFIERDEAMKRLAPHGFMSVDAYTGALDDVAGDAGAEAVIGEDFEGGRGDCHLRITLVDAKHLYALGEYSTRIPCSADLTRTALSLLQDPENGVSMIVRQPQSPDAPRDSALIRLPTCLKCPDPHYSEFARQRGVQGRVRMMITVTENGVVENAKGIGAVEESLQRVSLETVKGWKLSPAIGPDGKPFRCRVQVEVIFQLVPR